MNKYFHCGCCGQFHRVGFSGDCREDAERYNVEDLDERHGREGWEEEEYEQ